jgi:hypothetical protein
MIPVIKLSYNEKRSKNTTQLKVPKCNRKLVENGSVEMI